MRLATTTHGDGARRSRSSTGSAPMVPCGAVSPTGSWQPEGSPSQRSTSRARRERPGRRLRHRGIRGRPRRDAAGRPRPRGRPLPRRHGARAGGGRLAPAHALYLDPGFRLALPTDGLRGRLFWAAAPVSVVLTALAQKWRSRGRAPLAAEDAALRKAATARFDKGMAIGVFREVAHHPAAVTAPAVPSTVRAVRRLASRAARRDRRTAGRARMGGMSTHRSRPRLLAAGPRPDLGGSARRPAGRDLSRCRTRL